MSKVGRESHSEIIHVTSWKWWIIHIFFRGFLSHFPSHLPHFYDATWLIFESLLSPTTKTFPTIIIGNYCPLSYPFRSLYIMYVSGSLREKTMAIKLINNPNDCKLNCPFFKFKITGWKVWFNVQYFF